MAVKSFAELSRETFWGSYVIKWREAMLKSPRARAKGFTEASICETSIAAFVNAAMAEKIKAIAWDQLDPSLVTANGKDWHELQLPSWRN